MRRRLLLLNLDPLAPATVPRVSPLVVLPLPGGRVAVPLCDETAEEVLATLLAGGLATRRQRHGASTHAMCLCTCPPGSGIDHFRGSTRMCCSRSACRPAASTEMINR